MESRWLPILDGLVNPRPSMILTNSSFDLVSRGLYFNSSPTEVVVSPKKELENSLVNPS